MKLAGRLSVLLIGLGFCWQVFGGGAEPSAREKGEPQFLLLREVEGATEALDKALALRGVVTLFRFGEPSVYRVVQLSGSQDPGAIWARLNLAGLIEGAEPDATRFNPWLRRLLEPREAMQAAAPETGSLVTLLVKLREGTGLVAGGRIHEQMGAVFLRAFGAGAVYQVVELVTPESASEVVGRYLSNLMVEKAWACGEEWTGGGAFAGDTLLVQFEGAADEAARAAFAAAFGVTPIYESRLVEGVVAYRTQDDKRPARNVVLAAGLFPKVKRTEPDLLRYPCAVPNDPRFVSRELWGLQNTGEDGNKAGFDINAVPAWDVRSDTGDLIVAVIDTGTRFTHQDLAANVWKNPGEIPGNGVDDDGNGFVDDVFGVDTARETGVPFLVEDDDGHGTHVAGTIGAVGNNGIGVTGVAWKTRLLLIKAAKIFPGDDEPAFPSSAIMRGLEYAVEKGASVANASFGGPGYSFIEESAFRAAGQAGLVVIAAAGNADENLDQSPSYPANFLVPSLISVGATNAKGEMADFSNFGKTTTINAPGDDILSTLSGSDSDYGLLSGTSMAAPHVTGVFALAKAQHPGFTNLELLHHVIQYSNVTVTGTKSVGVNGMPNLNTILRSVPDRLSSPRLAESLGSGPVPDLGAIEGIASMTTRGPVGVPLLNLEVNHARPSDLQITVTAPNGQGMTFRPSGRPGVGLTITEGPLWALTGTEGFGMWKLKVEDTVAGVTGTLVSWNVDLRFRQPSNLDLTPRVRLSSGSYTVRADDGQLVVGVRRSGDLGKSASVSYFTGTGSAVPDVHYTPVAGEVSFVPGQSEATFVVPVMNSGQVELRPRTFSVNLSDPIGVALAAPSSALVTIPRHNLGFFEFTQPTYEVMEGQGVLRVVVRRREFQGENATVDFFTSDGTARGGSVFAGADFEHTFRRIMFFAGVPEMVVEVPIHADGEFEMDEQFFIHLTRPTNDSSLGNPRVAPVTIKNRP